MMDGMSEQKPRQVQITADGLLSSVVIDGHDVSELLTGARLDLAPRSLPMLTLKATSYQGIRYSGPALVELAGAEVQSVAEWLRRQAEDETLEPAMMSGSLDSSPFDALMAELIRRASE